MDDLHERLTSIASGGSPRGADAIWTEAHRRVRHRARVRTLRVGIAVAVVIAVIVAVAWPDGSTPAPRHPIAAPGVATLPRDATLARADVPRASGAGVDTSAVVAGDSAFGVDLYEQLSTSPGNIIFSPQSLATALAMTAVGAHGPTQSEMLHVLHAADATQLSQQLNALDQRLLEPRTGGPREGSPARLTIDDSMWAQTGYPFYKTFLSTIARYYGSGVHLVDYQNDPELARVTINRYVAAKTGGRIPNLIPVGDINDLTRFALVNTLTFNGAWVTQFQRAGVHTFHLPDGTPTNVPMMSAEEFAASTGNGYQAVRLPYVGGASMTIIVPDAGRFDEIERNLGATLAAVRAARKTQLHEVELVMPTFAFSSGAELEDPLKALGMRAAFDPARADFSNMTPPNNLYVSHVIQDAHIAVDEHGTEAEAASVVLGELQSLPPTLNVDRPFLFTITDDATGAVLFLGRVTNPNAH